MKHENFANIITLCNNFQGFTDHAYGQKALLYAANSKTVQYVAYTTFWILCDWFPRYTFVNPLTTFTLRS